MTIIFFGSFQHYSALILEALLKNKNIKIEAVVTSDENNPSYQLAQAKHIRALSPKILDQNFLSKLERPDLLVMAGYGKLLPSNYLAFPKIKALNLHFSLLPKYKGANPAEWAILNGETETGITLIEMDEKFDTGNIIFQEKMKISAHDTRETLYQKLYELGATVLPGWLKNYQNGNFEIVKQKNNRLPYAKRFFKKDSFVAWADLFKDPTFISRACRAWYGFPGLWTKIPSKKGDKIMKIWSCHLADKQLILDEVQVEGQNKARFNQIKNMILT